MIKKVDDLTKRTSLPYENYWPMTTRTGRHGEAYRHIWGKASPQLTTAARAPWLTERAHEEHAWELPSQRQEIQHHMHSHKLKHTNNLGLAL